VLASIFGGAGGYESASTFIDGMIPALWVGAIVVAVGAVLAALIPPKRQAAQERISADELIPQAEAA
jgi:hypothetical protein